MRADPSGVYRSVTCPYCAARPGRPCRNQSGFAFRGQLVHRERARDVPADEVAARRIMKAAQ